MQHALNELTRVLSLKERQLKEPMDQQVITARTKLLNEQIASIKKAIEKLIS